MPPDARRRLLVTQRLAQDGAVVEVVRAVRDRGISHLLLKGAAFARWLYDDPGERSYRDIDVLGGLVVVYVWRPFWLLGKLPSGWRAWRRAAAMEREWTTQSRV